MIMNGKQILYWDTCIFIAWLKDEPRHSDEKQGIRELVELIHTDRAILLTSLITRIEVLDCTLSNSAQENFNKLFQRKNFQEKVVNQRIALLAHDIRNFYQKVEKNAVNIKVPDAIHLATAIHYRADKFYTFDGKKRGGLLRLNGNVAGHNLIICKPRVEPFALKG